MPETMTASGPISISPTIQVFRGERYWLHKHRGVFVRRLPGQKARFLHREVYSGTYGNIPHGWEIHHRDRDRQHNDIDNLIAMAPRDHKREHQGEKYAWAGKNRSLLLNNLDRGRRTPREKMLFICSMCGREYFARPSYGLRKNTCCSQACLNRAYRRRKQEALHA